MATITRTTRETRPPCRRRANRLGRVSAVSQGRQAGESASPHGREERPLCRLGASYARGLRGFWSRDETVQESECRYYSARSVDRWAASLILLTLISATSPPTSTTRGSSTTSTAESPRTSPLRFCDVVSSKPEPAPRPGIKALRTAVNEMHQFGVDAPEEHAEVEPQEDDVSSSETPRVEKDADAPLFDDLRARQLRRRPVVAAFLRAIEPVPVVGMLARLLVAYSPPAAAKRPARDCSCPATALLARSRLWLWMPVAVVSGDRGGAGRTQTGRVGNDQAWLGNHAGCWRGLPEAVSGLELVHADQRDLFRHASLLRFNFYITFAFAFLSVDVSPGKGAETVFGV
uniref:Uncharacterized protein n=1 Tax=Mycena chlorophos TaxID=658473 RepID=A0ABQ0L0L3_MYCCL|nr:predicted protein [Mycena chlorophos]